MIAKIFLISTLLAVAYAAPGALLAQPAITTFAASPIAYHAVASPAVVKTVAHGPIAYSALAGPAAVAYSAPVAIPAPVTYTSGVKVTHVHEPVEQHGYQIAY